MNLRRALTFFFQDPHWVQILGIAVLLSVPPGILAALGFQVFGSVVPPELQVVTRSPLWSLLLVSITNIPLYGYELRITRQVIQGHDLPLPAWSDVTGILRDGMLLWVVITSWSLLSLIVEYFTGSRSQETSYSLLTLISGLIGAIVTLLIQPAAQGRLAATGSLRAALEPTAVLGTIGRHLWMYVRLAMAILLVSIICFAVVLALILLAAFAIGQFREPLTSRSNVEIGIALTLLIAGPYIRFVSAHVIGQVTGNTSRP